MTAFGGANGYAIDTHVYLNDAHVLIDLTTRRKFQAIPFDIPSSLTCNFGGNQSPIA